MADDERILKLKLLLKDLFQFENNDLDFGIYRIINIKKKEISEFIDVELFDIVKENIRNFENSSELQDSLESLEKEIKTNLGCDIDEAKKKYPEVPVVMDYLDKEKEIQKFNKESDIEEEIYDDIINFFSRYYDKGDFISKRRYSKDSKYAIPCNGEEVYLHWANNDQYYIKTGENFNHYSFKTGAIKVDFEITSEEVDVEKNNIKDADKKYFILSEVDYDSRSKHLVVKFGYRGLTDGEKETIKDLTGKKRIGKDEVNQLNLKQINERIAIYGLSDLQKKHIKMDGDKSDKAELEWHLNKYTTKNTSDYFIHKNLKKFLSQELDFYIKNEILHIDDIDSKEDFDINLRKIKVFKEISLKIIEFLSQVEEFQKKLWEKKKFVISTDYCITLDYIDEKYYPEILKNKGQVEEWKNLYSFDIEADVKRLKGKLTLVGKNDEEKKIEILKQNPTLVIDTKLYDIDFKYKILGEIDNLDEKITGFLINSDNFQALNLIKNKYENKIDTIIIDPPYNTGKDGFLYKDGFSNSSWLSLMYDRILLSTEFLTQRAIFFSHINDFEVSNLKHLFSKIFTNSQFLAQLVWANNEGGSGSDSSNFRIKHEYLLSYCNNINEVVVNGVEITNKDRYSMTDDYYNERGPFYLQKLNQASIQYSKSLDYPIKTPDGTVVYPIQGKKRACWRWSEKKLEWGLENDFIFFKKDKDDNWQVYSKQYLNVDNNNNPINRTNRPIGIINEYSSIQGNKEIQNLFETNKFTYSKPYQLSKYLINLSGDNNSTVLDFFAGSGTTGHAVLKLNKENEGNRKFILVEMGQYFETVLKPRILKVIYSDNWKNGEPQDNNGSKKQIIKYQVLEQYEDSLNNIDFKEPTTLAKESKDYKIKYMLEFESKGSNVFLNLDAINNPFEYKLKVYDDNEFKEQNVDLVETFNHIAGIDVKSIKRKQDDKTTYLIVKGNRKDKDVIVIWRNKTDGFEPERDKEFIEKEILNEEYDEIIINGNSLVENAKSIDEIFKSNMFRG